MPASPKQAPTDLHVHIALGHHQVILYALYTHSEAVMSKQVRNTVLFIVKADGQMSPWPCSHGAAVGMSTMHSLRD